jgi:hypothetical protein
MTLRRRVLSALLASALVLSPAHALFNLNQGKDLVLASATYSLGYDSNVFTRATAKGAFTQNASASVEYARQAGLIGVTASLAVASGRFESIRGQDFLDPSFAISLRKRYGRTTGTASLQARRDSQPDPDVGERTRAWNFSAGVDARYPVNDRYYLTNGLQATARQYGRSASAYTDLATITDAIAVNYEYTSKLDLNTGYTLGITDTGAHSKAYDHSWTIGAAGSILPKLSGTINVGLQRRNSRSTTGGAEAFNSFTSGTTLKWMYSRRLSINGDLSQSFSTSATDVSVNRATAGLHATGSISSRYIANAGIAYTISDFLGKAGAGRRDDMLQFDASIGLALTTHFRATLSAVYMLNYSNFAPAEFERFTCSLALAANY